MHSATIGRTKRELGNSEGGVFVDSVPSMFHTFIHGGQSLPDMAAVGRGGPPHPRPGHSL
jgi:hypothetical protein